MEKMVIFNDGKEHDEDVQPCGPLTGAATMFLEFPKISESQ